ncbi:hypothetical protein F2P56_018893, partial [Juglans regia]
AQMQRLELQSHNRLCIADSMHRLGLHDHMGASLKFSLQLTVANSIEELTMLMDFPLLYGCEEISLFKGDSSAMFLSDQARLKLTEDNYEAKRGSIISNLPSALLSFLISFRELLSVHKLFTKACQEIEGQENACICRK